MVNEYVVDLKEFHHDSGTWKTRRFVCSTKSGASAAAMALNVYGSPSKHMGISLSAKVISKNGVPYEPFKGSIREIDPHEEENPSA